MDQLMTVIWSDNCNPTGVVKIRFKGPTFPLPTMAVQSKGQTKTVLNFPLLMKVNIAVHTTTTADDGDAGYKHDDTDDADHNYDDGEGGNSAGNSVGKII